MVSITTLATSMRGDHGRSGSGGSPSGKRPVDWEDHVENLVRQGLFRRRYRMTLEAFNEAVGQLRPRLERVRRFACE